MRRQALHSWPSHLGSLILDFLSSGSTFAELLANYPGLVEEDILACIAYGSEMKSIGVSVHRGFAF